MLLMQKIFNFIHSSPKASHFKIKDLNVYFKESVNPTYKLINLENIDSLELQIESEDKYYNLVVYILKDFKESAIVLGKFENKKDAEQAFHQVKNKIYGGAKNLLTIANGVVLFVIYTAFLIGFANSLKPVNNTNPNNPNLSSLATGGMQNMSLGGVGSMPNLNGTNGGNVNMADMSKLQKQLLQQALQQAGQPGATGVANVPTLQSNPLGNSGAAMNNIVSDAINQAQGQSPVDGQPMPQAVNPQVTNTPQTVQPVEQPRSPGDDLLKQIQ